MKRTKPGRLALAKAQRGSKLEQSVVDILKEMKLRFKTQKRIGPYRVDIYIPKFRLVVECDGHYWHTLPGAAVKDKQRDKYLKSIGYHTIRILEKRLKKQGSTYVRSAICKFAPDALAVNRK